MTRDLSKNAPTSPAEQMALALLYAGLSYAEAMKQTGLSFDVMVRLWQLHGKGPAKPFRDGPLA